MCLRNQCFLRLRNFLTGCILLGIGLLSTPSFAYGEFDFDSGNAPFEVVIPTVIPVILADVSGNAGDPTLIFRITTLVTNGWFDAIAPYHETAVGVFYRSDVRLQDATNAEKNVAILYASKVVLNSVLPGREDVWHAMLADLGLDPADESTDPATAVGVGNLAGRAILQNRLQDGMNQLGNEGGCEFNCQPYADYTGYEPVNSAQVLRNPSRWQPSFVTDGNGKFHIQQFITPQLGRTKPYSYKRAGKFRAPRPTASRIRNYHAYRAQADEVLAVSAALSDQQKMTAELFDHKFNSVFGAVGFTVASRGLSLEDSVYVEFLTNMASFDTAIAIWRNKYRYDAVRPFSAIAHLYGEHAVTAWGGPGQGTTTLPGKQWTSYLRVADHPEYPSATASFCAAHAAVMRRFLGDDQLGYEVVIPAGSSVVEPGVTPSTDMVLAYPTWTALEDACGISRLWGGVHFYASIPAGMDIGHEIGAIAYDWVQDHISGAIAQQNK